MHKQLYRLIPDIELPDIIDTDTGELLHNGRKFPGYYSFIWPNGAPCLIAEMYLLDKSYEVKVSKKDGGTLGNYARNISHIIKFCFNKKIELWELTHKNIDKFVDELCGEKDTYNVRVRDNNTVKKIAFNCINFLVWIQENIARDHRIAGVDSQTDRYQIKLIRKSYRSYRGALCVHSVFPLSIPNTIKPATRPISNENIKSLWNTLGETKSSMGISNKLKGKFSKKQQNEHLEFMYKRRELQLLLLEATGLRPQELITIECSNNIANLSKCQLSIPTLKGRKNARENKRLIPIPRNIAIKIELFIAIHREKLIQRLIAASIINSLNDIDDVLYLNSENGKEVLPDAAYQEFRRLTVKAGIKQKNCQSMFRHRFITNMVKLHLIGFMDKNPLKNRQIMADNDYRTILKKVATFTGHKNLDSLFHYIDLAWDELDAFSYTHEVKELQERLKSIFYIVHSIKNDIQGLSKSDISAKVEALLNKQLLEIEELTSTL